ncbi:MAG: 50S ribosomal protein L6 [Hyphomicrobiaceae bacterium]|nr:50S ribosomal protein L6 [Hyphomicrobiaceae bacterium]
MSRMGKLPVGLSGVTITINGNTVTAKGAKGELSVDLLDDVNIEQTDEGLVMTPANDTKQARANWGTTRALVNNVVHGVSKGFEKKLQITGVGYRAAMQGNDLKLSLGFSHEVIYKAPDGISLATPTPTEIIVSGIDKCAVGQVAADIRDYRPPEPYKGKGVRYENEHIFRKEGKKK